MPDTEQTVWSAQITLEVLVLTNRWQRVRMFSEHFLMYYMAFYGIAFLLYCICIVFVLYRICIDLHVVLFFIVLHLHCIASMYILHVGHSTRLVKARGL